MSGGSKEGKTASLTDGLVNPVPAQAIGVCMQTMRHVHTVSASAGRCIKASCRLVPSVIAAWTVRGSALPESGSSKTAHTNYAARAHCLLGRRFSQGQLNARSVIQQPVQESQGISFTWLWKSHEPCRSGAVRRWMSCNNCTTECSRT